MLSPRSRSVRTFFQGPTSRYRAPVTPTPPLPAVPFDAVLFDLHSTLVDQGSGRAWLDLAWQHAGRDGDPAVSCGEAEVARLAGLLQHIWEDARDVDPSSDRDLDPARHRAVFEQLVRRMGGIDPDLAASLYATLTDGWTAYDDALPVLHDLRHAGIRTALLSNVGIDIRSVLDRTGLSAILDGVVLSCEIGVTKPKPAAFLRALEVAGSRPERTLMVGDSWSQDGAAAQVGIRTLILPRTVGPVHGLSAVRALVLGA
jgi:HAD superfamily hydrolase (TIGR01509 family)